MHSTRTASDTIAEQVRKHRTRLGLNREQLADECARLGAPDLTYAAITNIETGRRKSDGTRRREVTVDELLVLGLALAVPPLLLVLPLGTEETVPSVPAADRRDPYTVWKWVTGEETPTLAGPVDGRHYADPRPIGEGGPKWSAAWSAAAYTASLYPEFERRRFAVTKAYRLAKNANADPSTEKERATEAQQHYFERLDDLAQVINDMTRAGLAVPEVQPDWIDDMKGLDVLDTPDAISTTERGTE
ncbi:helix-turn-helix transcriptional regulator [Streptomyces albiflaviniger]|nr:helix-turn-helix transcriptional regulator [Streptomyces albiflaviniger]